MRLVDLRASGGGRRYVIEHDLTSIADLEGIVADDLEQAARRGAPPAEPLCPLNGTVEPKLR
jgi:hypothetical protein